MVFDVKTFNFKKNLPIEFEIKDLSEIKSIKQIFSKAHKATFYQIIWINEGEASFYIDFRKIIIHAGEILIVAVNQIIKFDIESEYKGKIILFTDTFFNQTEIDTSFLQTAEILNPSQLNQVVKLNIKQIDTIFGLIKQELLLPVTEFQFQIIQNYLRIILLNSERVIRQQNPNICHADKDIIRRFYDEVEKQFRTHKQVDYYLQQLGIGEKVLAKKIKIQTNKTPKQYINNRIILEAKRLLVYSSLNIKEIAFELGFDEATNFTKFFKKLEGVTPHLFKEQEIDKRS